MRVCFVNEFFYPDNTGGTGTVLSDLARRLTDEYEDLQIDVITSTNLYRKPVEKLSLKDDWAGITIHRIPSRHPNDVSMVKRTLANIDFTFKALIKLFQLATFDLIVIGTAPPLIGFAAYVHQRISGTPFIYIIYDLEPDRSVAMNLLKRRNPLVRAFGAIQKIWLQAASRVVVLGRCMQSCVAKTYSLPLDKIDVIPTGANADEIVPGAKNSRFRAKHGIQGFMLLYTGNFGRYHNFDTVLDASQILQAKNCPIQFVLVGDGVQKEHIAERVRNENMANVHIYDFVSTEEYSDLLASADASLVTLEPGMEGLCVPSKFYSILASGRPTIAVVSKFSEVSMVIAESNCGIHVAEGDTNQLLAALELLASNADLASEMGKNARQVLEERYSTSLVAAQFYESFHLACNLSSPQQAGTSVVATSREIAS